MSTKKRPHSSTNSPVMTVVRKLFFGSAPSSLVYNATSLCSSDVVLSHKQSIQSELPLKPPSKSSMIPEPLLPPPPILESRARRRTYPWEPSPPVSPRSKWLPKEGQMPKSLKTERLRDLDPSVYTQ